MKEFKGFAESVRAYGWELPSSDESPYEQQMRAMSEYVKEEGVKFDDDKEPYDLIAPELLESVSIVLALGARKYSSRNWENGMRWGRVFAATMRHMWKWWIGESKDRETGYSHLWHAATNIMFLIAYEARNVGSDDRPSIQRGKL